VTVWPLNAQHDLSQADLAAFLKHDANAGETNVLAPSCCWFGQQHELTFRGFHIWNLEDHRCDSPDTVGMKLRGNGDREVPSIGAL
jgi:hypothetical protein